MKAIEVAITSSILEPNRILYIFRNDGIEVTVVLKENEIAKASRRLRHYEVEAIYNYIQNHIIE